MDLILMFTLQCCVYKTMILDIYFLMQLISVSSFNQRISLHQYNITHSLPQLKLLVKCYFRITKQIYLKRSCENHICMHFCIQRNSKPVSFMGTKVGTNGTHHWKVNMCLTLFEEIWLQNNKLMDFSKHASWFAQQVFLNFRSKHQDVMF